MIGRQRELADETFERRNTLDENADDLANREGDLGGDLDDLIDELQGGGDDPNGGASRSLGQARNEMRDAEQALRNGDFPAAGDAMERAIADLRDGAEKLAREQARQRQQGRWSWLRRARRRWTICATTCRYSPLCPPRDFPPGTPIPRSASSTTRFMSIDCGCSNRCAASARKG